MNILNSTKLRQVNCFITIISERIQENREKGVCCFKITINDFPEFIKQDYTGTGFYHKNRKSIDDYILARLHASFFDFCFSIAISINYSPVLSIRIKKHYMVFKRFVQDTPVTPRFYGYICGGGLDDVLRKLKLGFSSNSAVGNNREVFYRKSSKHKTQYSIRPSTHQAIEKIFGEFGKKMVELKRVY